MRVRNILFTLISVCVCSAPVYAVPSIDGRPGPREHVRRHPKHLLRNAPNTTAAPNEIIHPATGTQKVAVILVQFASSGGATGGDAAATLSNIDIIGFNKTFRYLKKFYAEASYNLLDLEITFITQSSSLTLTDVSGLSGFEAPYTLPSPMAHYGSDDAGQAELIADSLSLVGSSVTAPAFDAVLIAHAGYGEESNTGNTADIWSAMTGFGTDASGNEKKVNGFTDGAVFPAREDGTASPIGVTCHEFGHILGFPDLYKTATSADPTQSVKVGYWCLMDQGAWLGDGATPAPPSLWCRALEGWVVPKPLSSQQMLSGVIQSETNNSTVYQIPVLNSSSEYFLVCYSSKSAYNVVPPGQGFLIWHIDEGTIDGTTFVQRLENNVIDNFSHNTVALVTASNTTPDKRPFGTANDPWPGLKGTFTTPDSDSYSGQRSGIVISNFLGSSLDLSTNKMSDKVGFAGLFNYPNPAGAGYNSGASGILTTFAMQYTRPPRTMSLDIYTLSGEHVRSIKTGDIKPPQRSLNPNNDFKWVYEYGWDGRNDSGDNVAPGVYIYRATGDDAIKLGRMAVVR